MDDPFAGAGIWIWYLPTNWQRLFQQLRDQGINTVYVKCGDWVNQWSQFTPEIVEYCHSIGLKCNAWHYVYGDPQESDVCFNVVSMMPDAYVFDVEYEVIGKQMGDYVQRMRDQMRGTPMGYALDLRIAFGNRWPASTAFVPHEEFFDWEAWSQCDAVLPQLYYTTFQTAPDLTVQLADLWGRGCMERGWRIPDKYPILPADSSVEA